MERGGDGKTKRKKQGGGGDEQHVPETYSPSEPGVPGSCGGTRRNSGAAQPSNAGPAPETFPPSEPPVILRQELEALEPAAALEGRTTLLIGPVGEASAAVSSPNFASAPPNAEPYATPAAIPGAFAVSGPGANAETVTIGDADADGDNATSTLTTSSRSAPVLSAELVDDEELRRRMFADATERILSEAPRAEPVAVAAAPGQEEDATKKRRRIYACGLGSFFAVVSIAVIGAVVGTSTRIRPTQSQPQSQSLAPTASPHPSVAPSQYPSAPPSREIAWRQVGQVLEGDQEGYHYFGASVDITYNGSAVAVGAMPDNDAQSYVEIYRRDETEDKWELWGTKIYSVGDNRARAADFVFLSDDHKTLFVFFETTEGLAHVYALEQGNWVLRHAFTGMNISTYQSYGSSVPVNKIRIARASPDGNRFVAVLAATNSSEHIVRVYYTSAGSTFGRPFYESEIGRSRSVAISRQGSVLVIGAYGHATAFHYGRDDWISPGFRLTSSSQYATTSFGADVTISGDGTTIAIVDASSFENAGSVTVFRSSGVERWAQIGDVIVGDLNSGQTIGRGGHVSLSDDGNIAGVNGKIGNINPGSRFKTFRFNGVGWEELNSVQDYNTDEYPCALSGDGLSLCCGSPYDLEYGDDVGLVTVYQYSRRPPRAAPTPEPATLDQECWRKLLPDDGFYWFGGDVAISGDTIVTTARNATTGSYSPHVFVRLETAWVQQSNLPAAGARVAIDGDTIVVGFASGSVFAFHRLDATWREQAKLGPDSAHIPFFAYSVAIDGNYIVVGSPEANDRIGSAHVYVRSKGRWTMQAKVTPQDGATGDRFGEKVAIHGDIIVVGARRHDSNGNENSGAAYVFTRSGTTWEPNAKLVPNDVAARDTFGTSVAIHGGTIIVGSPGDDDNGSISGSVYVFVLSSGAEWDIVTKIIPEDGAAGDKFGESVAIDNGNIVIGSPGDDSNAKDSGSAYVFSSNFELQGKLVPESGDEFDGFGLSVAVDSGTIVVGAKFTDSGSARNGGSIYVGEACSSCG